MGCCRRPIRKILGFHPKTSNENAQRISSSMKPPTRGTTPKGVVIIGRTKGPASFHPKQHLVHKERKNATDKQAAATNTRKIRKLKELQKAILDPCCCLPKPPRSARSGCPRRSKHPAPNPGRTGEEAPDPAASHPIPPASLAPPGAGAGRERGRRGAADLAGRRHQAQDPAGRLGTDAHCRRAHQPPQPREKQEREEPSHPRGSYPSVKPRRRRRPHGTCPAASSSGDEGGDVVELCGGG